MLERLRKVFTREKAFPPPEPLSAAALGAWAAAQGLEFTMEPEGGGFEIRGKVGQMPWKLERGASTRSFIRGMELRGRTMLGLHEDVSLMVLNRHLKDALEQMAFAEFTDSLRTGAESNLPDEVRWLSMYEEVRVKSAPIGFEDMYAVLAHNPEHAHRWVTPGLATELMRWPEAVTPDTPITLMAYRGNAYMRMQYDADDLAVLGQAARIYPMACLMANQGLPKA